MLVLVAVLAVQPAARAEEDRWDEDNWLWQYCGDTSCGQAWCVFSGPTFVGAPAPPTASRRRRSSAAPRRRSATPRSYCTGAGRDCPADGFEPNTKICRASVGPCDVTDKCTGFSNDCPADTHVTDGLACAPGSKCFQGGTCGGGACSGGTYELSFGPAAPALADGASQVVTITHSGSGAAIQLTGASVSPAEFTLAAEPTWPVTLASGQSTAVTVRFDGAVVGDFAGERAIEAATAARRA